MSRTTRPRWLTVGIVSLATVAALAGAGIAAADTVKAAPEAGTVKVEFSFSTGWRVIYTAGAGVANDVELRGTRDPILGVHDKAAPVTMTGWYADLFCEQMDPNTVRCEGLTRISISLGDGNDKFNFEGHGTVSVDGGAGNDNLKSYSDIVRPRFDGGPGQDVCSGEPVTRVNCEA